MAKYRKGSHTTYDCRYHLVWITKYRNKCLTEEMQKRLEKILRGVCNEWYVNILSIGMEEDHVHMYISIPLSKPIPQVVQALKGRSSRFLRKEFSLELGKWYWKSVLWADGYFIATVGEINHETIKNYVDMQGKEDVLGIEVEI